MNVIFDLPLMLLRLFAFVTLITLGPQLNFANGQVSELNLDLLKPQLEFRCIGPFRGGRSAAVAGVEGKPMLFYMGATGGGVWKTENGGTTWTNISDGYFGGSIGAIAVSSSHPNVIYVGGGEVTVRGNVSPGTGMYNCLLYTSDAADE